MTDQRNTKVTEQVVLGAHGKLKAWISNRLLEVSEIRILVFDEADEMLKADAFADDSLRMIRTIRQKSPKVFPLGAWPLCATCGAGVGCGGASLGRCLGSLSAKINCHYNKKRALI